jgi:hypothetical protein
MVFSSEIEAPNPKYAGSVVRGGAEIDPVTAAHEVAHRVYIKVHGVFHD